MVGRSLAGWKGGWNRRPNRRQIDRNRSEMTSDHRNWKFQPETQAVLKRILYLKWSCNPYRNLVNFKFVSNLSNELCLIGNQFLKETFYLEKFSRCFSCKSSNLLNFLRIAYKNLYKDLRKLLVEKFAGKRQKFDWKFRTEMFASLDKRFTSKCSTRHT